MSLERTVTISGHDVRMRASALIPRLYRSRFGRDIMTDMADLAKDYTDVAAAKKEGKPASLSIDTLTMIEDITWLMAYHADPENIPDSPDAWLDSIDGVLSVYAVIPAVLSLWKDSQTTTAIPAKK